MIIKFDGSPVNPEYIRYLSQSGKMFETNFRLGATLCKSFTLHVNRAIGGNFAPNFVYFYDDENNLLNTLHVDDIDTTNEKYYALSLTDLMVRFNAVINWSKLTEPTVQSILEFMCMSVLGTHAPTVAYMGDLGVTWSDDITARDFISNVAEVNGCYARVNSDQELEFVPVKQNITHVIEVNTCKDLKIGSRNVLTRVCYNNGTFFAEYPPLEPLITQDGDYIVAQNEDNIVSVQSVGAISADAYGDGKTYYLNPDNILITDSGGYTRESIVRHIYNTVGGFEFYNLQTTRCQFDDSIEPGELIGFRYSGGILLTQNADPLVTQDDDEIAITGVVIPTIAQYDWDYYGKWYGGFNLEVENNEQEETQILGENDAIRKIDIKLDRELGTIQQNISQINEDLSSQASEITQTSNELNIRVSRVESDVSGAETRLNAFETAVSVTAEGVTINQGTEGNYAQFIDSGMDIYVNNEKTAWAEAQGFSAKELMIGTPERDLKWHLHETNNGATLMFLRR